MMDRLVTWTESVLDWCVSNQSLWMIDLPFALYLVLAWVVMHAVWAAPNIEDMD